MALAFKDIKRGNRFAEREGCRTPGRVWIVSKKLRGRFGKRPNKVEMWTKCEGKEGSGCVKIAYSMAEINRLFVPAAEGGA